MNPIRAFRNGLADYYRMKAVDKRDAARQAPFWMKNEKRFALALAELYEALADRMAGVNEQEEA